MTGKAKVNFCSLAVCFPTIRVVPDTPFWVCR